MSADILSDPTYPHGTVEGFTRGCRGSHCPGPMICREVHHRYQGDYAFRKAIDAGQTAAEVLHAEQEAVRAAEHARRAAIRAEVTKRRGTAGGTPRTRTPSGVRVPVTAYQKAIHELVTVKGYTDREVADALGKTREQTAAARKYLGLPANLANRSNRAPAPTGASS